MLNAREVGLTASREIRRNLRSAKGIAMFAIFFIGGLVASLANVWLTREAEKQTGLSMSGPEAQASFEMLLTKVHESEVIGKHLSGSPFVVYGLFQGTLTFLPLIIVLMGFDQIASEVQHRTLRFSAARAHRASLVVGKAVGIWGVVAIMTLVLHLTVWVIVIAQGVPAGKVLSWGSRFYLFSAVAAGAYVGFSSLVSSLVKTPVVALFIGMAAGFGCWLTYKILNFFESTRGAAWIFPNRYEKLLISPEIGSVAVGLALFVLWGALCVAGSSVILARRDI
jgi:ABC-type transport system involved in multi-copper enzyme maturation permease subunit